MSAEKPVIIFVQGSWHQLIHYGQFLRSLRNKGYTVISPELPSCSDNVPTNPTEADIELIRTEGRKLVEDAKEVVAIAHSYGGIVMTEALYGLGIKERARKGLQGGIRTLIYNTAFLPSINVCMEDVANISLFDWLEYKGGWKVFTKDPATLFYSDLPEIEAKKWIAHTRPHPQSCSFYRPKRLAYDGIDVAYLYAEKDCVVPLFAQEQLVEALKLNGVAVGEWRLPSGHFPSLSMPDILADKIVEIISA